jgi:hypothetical protein
VGGTSIQIALLDSGETKPFQIKIINAGTRLNPDNRDLIHTILWVGKFNVNTK